MPCRRILIVVVLFLLSYNASYAAEIKIGLYYGVDIRSIVFSTVEGEYLMEGDGKKVVTIKRGTMFHIELSETGLAVHDTTQSYGIFTSLKFKGVSAINVFQVRPVYPVSRPKESEGELTVSIYHDAIRLINKLDLEEYVPGTVEAEGGSVAPAEYYKAQAVITRTFAIKNFHRHAHEGFNLCDGVHCQAFNGKSRLNKKIYEATKSTKNEILVNITGEPVVTAYHASCGGITGSASTEWNKDLPYLVPVNDPFCNRSAHRNWSKTIPAATWISYLQEKGYANVYTGNFTENETGRQKYLDRKNKKLSLKDIREDLELKSSFFQVQSADGNVIIHGHGYGHGLGLCQEGAMEMARVGFTYVDILMFYFRNLKIEKG
jgi:stage II sporulation protein D